MDNREYFIDINLGNSCNFRCKYCYEDGMETRSGVITEDVISYSIVFIDGILNKLPKNNSLVINFWGGEPTLHLEQMKKFLDYYFDNNRVKFMMITNGSQLHKNKEFFIKFKHKLMIQVSYDFEPCNSKNRTSKEISSLVRDNMKWLQENGFNWWIKSTMFTSDLSEYLYDTYMDFISFKNEINYPNLSLNITPDTRTWVNHIINLQGIEEQMKKLVAYFIKNNVKVTGLTWFDRYSKAQCASPTGGCLIDIDGLIYPCHGCSYMPETVKQNFVLFSVKDLNAVDKFFVSTSTFDIHQSDKCKNCDTWLCYRCNSSIATTNSGTIDSWNDPNPDYNCKIYKTISKYIYAYKKIINKR